MCHVVRINIAERKIGVALGSQDRIIVNAGEGVAQVPPHSFSRAEVFN